MILDSPEEPDHESLVLVEGGVVGLGLELADQLLAAAVRVHRVHQREEGLGVGLLGSLLNGPDNRYESVSCLFTFSYLITFSYYLRYGTIETILGDNSEW